MNGGEREEGGLMICRYGKDESLTEAYAADIWEFE